MTTPTMIPVIAFSEDQLIEKITTAVRAVFDEKEIERKKSEPQRLYSKFRFSKLTGQSYNTVKKQVSLGIIPVTQTGMITEASLQQYLSDHNIKIKQPGRR